MHEIEHYEILVIGSGEAGKWMTWTMAQAGHRTAVVERKYIGGSCPNIACLPSKNVIRSAKANWFARHAAEYAIQTGPVSTDMRGVFSRKKDLSGVISQKPHPQTLRRGEWGLATWSSYQSCPIQSVVRLGGRVKVCITTQYCSVFSRNPRSCSGVASDAAMSKVR